MTRDQLLADLLAERYGATRPEDVTGYACAECGRPMRPGKRRGEKAPGTRQHQGRGLCSGCYARALREGCLDDYPKSRDTDGFIEEVEWLAASGEPAERWAERLGIAPATAARRLYRSGRRDLANAVERVVWHQRQRRKEAA